MRLKRAVREESFHADRADYPVNLCLVVSVGRPVNEILNLCHSAEGSLHEEPNGRPSQLNTWEPRE